MPDVRGTDNGIWRRLKPIPFNGKFEGDALDPRLEEKLARELPGIRNWAIDGWVDLMMGGELVEPAAVIQAREAYQEEMNIVHQFVVDRCIRRDDLTVPTGMLYQNFRMYCEEHGLHVCSSRKFGKDLEQMGVTNDRTKHERIKVGITLRSQFEDAGSPEAAELF